MLSSDDHMSSQDGLSSGHASDLEEEGEAELPGTLSSQQRRPAHEQARNGHSNTMLSNLLALSEPSGAPRLPPPSPAPEAPAPPLPPLQEPVEPGPPSVAAAIKDIKKAIQSAKTLHPTPGCGPAPPDPWLPRGAANPLVQERVEAPLPAPPTSCPPTPPSPACSTPPPPPPLELQEETESEVEEEERVPTPEVMKKEDEDLDTDQVAAPNISQLVLSSLHFKTCSFWTCTF